VLGGRQNVTVCVANVLARKIDILIEAFMSVLANFERKLEIRSELLSSTYFPSSLLANQPAFGTTPSAIDTVSANRTREQTIKHDNKKLFSCCCCVFLSSIAVHLQWVVKIVKVKLSS
jgi:hypothetical protein